MVSYCAEVCMHVRRGRAGTRSGLVSYLCILVPAPVLGISRRPDHTSPNFQVAALAVGCQWAIESRVKYMSCPRADADVRTVQAHQVDDGAH